MKWKLFTQSNNGKEGRIDRLSTLEVIKYILFSKKDYYVEISKYFLEQGQVIRDE